MSRLSPFVLNDLVLSLLSLECPFRPVLCAFCPVLCPFCPSNKRLKFAQTVYFCWDLELLTWLNACAVIAQFRIVEQNVVKLSNHLSDVHELDYINRRKWVQETKLQPKVKVMIYSAKRRQGLKRSRGETPLSVQEEEKYRIVHQLSTPRGVKKSMKYLPRGVGKAANSIKHCKTTADSVPESYLSNTLTNLCIALYCILLYCVVLNCIVLLIYCYVDTVNTRI